MNEYEPEINRKLKATGQKIRSSITLTSVGLEMGFCVAIGYLIGDWLDSRLGTSPYLMVLFLLLGIAAAFLSLYKAYKRIQRRTEG